MSASRTAARSFVFVHTFDAPRETVWEAWTDRSARTQWWQPMGTPIEVKAYDVKPGGVMHYAMDTPAGDKWWGRFSYRDVAAPSRMVYVNSCSDENGGITRSPFNAHWPLEIFTTVTFTEDDGRTTVKLEGIPLHATEQEQVAFESGIESMQKAFANTFGQLDSYLATQK